MSKYEDLMVRFGKEVNKSHIKVSWDSGHCYTYIDHPIMSEEHSLDEEELEQWDEFTTEWLYKNDADISLYCVPELINELVVNRSVVSDSCYDDSCQTDEERIEYIEGFIDLLKTRTDGSSLNWYRVDLLEKWLGLKKMERIVKS